MVECFRSKQIRIDHSDPFAFFHIQVIGVNKIDKSQKRRLRNNKSVSSDDSSSNSSQSSGSNVPKTRRRRRRTKTTKNATQPQNDAVHISLEEQTKYVAMDCEMVGVGYMGRKSSVARVTLVGWNGETIFDEFVQQSTVVTDYRTFVSGITLEDLEGAVLSLEECRAKVTELLEGKFLVGHALKNDTKALNITHPWSMTRDTAKYEPFMQTRFGDGVLWPRKLRELTKLKLQREIQVDGQPHSAYEDALAALDLYKKHMKKWEKAMEYKINKTKEFQSKGEKNVAVATE
jgi:RNA exonuclease 4